MSYNDYLRKPKTKNEKKNYYKEPLLVRAKRKSRNLPSEWDDYERCIQRCWKYQNKKQSQTGYDIEKIRSFFKA